MSLCKRFSTFKVFLFTAMVAVVQHINAGLAYAASSWGTRATAVTSEVKSFKELGLAASVFIGIVLLIVGIMKLVKDSRQGDGGIGAAIIWIIAGVLMVAIPLLLSTTGQTIFGSDVNTN